MTTPQQSSRPATKEVEKNTMVLKLERHQENLLQLRLKLNSYTCEPKTYTLFERIEFLKTRLENLRTENAYMIASIKERRRNIEDYVERIKKQFVEFHMLQQGVEDYIRGARNC